MIIDAHLHNNFQDEKLQVTAAENHINLTLEGLQDEMVENRVDFAIAIWSDLPSIESRAPDITAREIYEQPPCNNLFYVAPVNPYADHEAQMEIIDALLKEHRIVGLKIYLGYYHFFPTDPIFTWVYEIAEKYGVPVIFHTGDTFSRVAKLKYAHPLLIDEVAVDFPYTKFVIAHFGSPWVMDAAEVIYKNDNVYADLSGWILGNNLEDVPFDQIKVALNYCGYKHLMYGSDWPLTPMMTYLRVIGELIPPEFAENVFYTTARDLFHIGTS